MTYPDTELDLEAPEADAAEQAAEAVPALSEEEDSTVSSGDERIVSLDDEYR